MPCANHILIVEDDEAILESLKELLEDSGYKTECAFNGEVALATLRSGRPLPSLIILDLMMPIMDGYQFRMEQQKDSLIKDIPVLIMSADGQVERKIKEISAEQYLKKPVLVEDVLKAVSRYCHD